MGRTISSITQTWQAESAALERFKRALRKDDQILLEELIGFSRLHLAEASYASNLYPMDAFLLSIILELYKIIRQIQPDHPQLSPESSKLIGILEKIATSELPSTVPVRLIQPANEPEYIPFYD